MLRSRFPSDSSSSEARNETSSNESSEAHGESSGPRNLQALYLSFKDTLVAQLTARFGPGPPEPEDIAQQAFERLQAREDLADIKQLENFVWISACNLIRSDFRAQRVRRDHAREAAEGVFFDLCDEIGPERVLLAREQIGIVMDALDELPARRRELFLLNRVEGLTPEQAGKAHGISRTAAARHIGLASAAVSKALLVRAPARWKESSN